MRKITLDELPGKEFSVVVITEGAVGGDFKIEVQDACVSCHKPITKDEPFVANDEGKRFHFRCCMRSQEYHDEFGR